MYIRIYYNLLYVFMLSSFLSYLYISIFFFLHETIREDIVSQSCPFFLSCLQDLEDPQIVGEGVQYCLCF